MEGQEVMVNGGISYGGGFSPYATGLEQVHCENDLSQVGDNKGKENLAEEVLEDLEEYWEDISDRLMISRMVSDSVVKGMVTAVEEEAAEKIASKELEVANLKKYLLSHEMGGSRFKDVNFPIVSEAYEFGNYGSFSCFPRPCVKHEKMREELHALKNLAREQFQSVKKEVELVRVSNPKKKIGSDSELGLGGILQEKQPESCMRIDKMLEHLKKTIDAVCLKVDDISVSSKVSLCELQEEQDLSAKLEVIVIESVLRRLMEEFEENLWEQNARSCGIHYVNWIEKFHDVSSLGNQLDAILKSLNIPDSGLDLDHLHNKVVSSHITPPTYLFGENGMLDASSIHVAESYDFQQLKHLSKEGLVEYFNNIITKMKRDHESALQQKTEEYFCLRREYLKERGSFMIHRKDEEFDVLRKKIPEVISKLEDFLLENERFPAVTYSLESIEKMKHRLDDLLSENCQLRDCLTDKENELKCLEAQAADAAAKLLKHSLSEENMLKNVENLNSAMKDSCIKASLNEEVYKCALREQIAQTRCDSEDSHMEFLITQEIHAIILGEAVIRAEMNRYKTEDSDIESLIMEGLSGLIYAESIKDAEQELNDLSRKLLIDKEIVICLEEKALEQENELRRVVEEKEKLKREIVDLGTEMKQKENLAMGLSILLSKEREQFELASEELHNLREIATQQQTMVTESSRELQLLRSQHLEALEQIEADKMEMHKLKRMVDETTELLTEANKQRNVAFSHTQEMHKKLVLCQAREEKLKKEVGIAVIGVSKMFDEFESGVSGAVIRNSLRLEETSSHLIAVNGIANGLRKKGLMYKQKLERRFADLQMAEAEVDLLGDEVDALLRLLEKIYIALDHYSPVLKHYPGIIEILELVRRELSGESAKLL